MPSGTYKLLNWQENRDLSLMSEFLKSVSSPEETANAQHYFEDQILISNFWSMIDYFYYICYFTIIITVSIYNPQKEILCEFKRFKLSISYIYPQKCEGLFW